MVIWAYADIECKLEPTKNDLEPYLNKGSRSFTFVNFGGIISATLCAERLR